MKTAKYNLLHFALVALLLFAQQAALTHEAEHASDPEIPSQQGGDDSKHFHSGLCAFHTTLAGVLGVVGTSAPPSCIASNAVEHRVSYVLVLAPVNVIVPAARGPPAPVLS